MVRTIDILGFPHAYELSQPTDAPIVLVFVHGWLLSRAYWQPVIQQLAPHYQCLSYDLRGFGTSQPKARLMEEGVVPASPYTDGVVPPIDRLNAKVPDPIFANVAARSSYLTEQSGQDPYNATTGRMMPFGERVPMPLDEDDRSPDPEESFSIPSCYTPAAYAQDLNLLLQELNISRAWLVGHSLGGSIALWAADQAPETIAGVICVNAGGGIYLKEEFERFRTAGQKLVKFRPRWLSYLPLVDLALSRMNVAQPISRQWGRQRLLDMLSAQPSAALGALLDSTTEAEVHRLPQVVARLSQPVHFIAGAQDTVMEPKYVHHLASFHASFQYCGNNVSEIANCGHLSLIEQPDAVATEIQAVLTRHLEQNSSPSPTSR